MKFKTLVILFAAMTVSATTISCAPGGKNKKSRISTQKNNGNKEQGNGGEKAAAPKGATPEKSTTPPTGGETPSPEGTKVTLETKFDAAAAAKIQEAYEAHILDGKKTIGKDKLNGKTLTLKEVVLKYSATAEDQSKDSFAAIGAYDAAQNDEKKVSLNPSVTLEATSTGDSKDQEFHSITTSYAVTFDESGRVDSSKKGEAIDLNVVVQNNLLAVDSDGARNSENVIAEDAIELLTRSGDADEKGQIHFVSSTGVEGTVMLLEAEGTFTIIIEIQNDYTTQVFALTYSVQ